LAASIAVTFQGTPAQWSRVPERSGSVVACPLCEVSSPERNAASETRFWHTLGDALNNASPRSYRQRAMRFPPQSSKRSRSHFSALLDNGSPNNANNLPARPIFALNLS
jgi:hypothetical protein